MKKAFLLLILVAILISCHQHGTTNSDRQTEIHKKYNPAIENVLDFFTDHAYDTSIESFYSDLDNQGNIVSQKVYNVALSRMIYGLACSSYFCDSNILRAEKASRFQIKHLTGKDSLGGYFRSFYNVAAHEGEQPESLDVWQQAYGLCGLSELYRQHSDDDLLKQIHYFHDGFVHRFHDTQYGGFVGNVHIENGLESGSKTLQSLMYPITAYMENLWKADEKHKEKYEPYLKENLALIYKNGWNKSLGWVNIKFEDHWEPCEHTSADSLCFTVSPGHNFQLASLFLRTKDWTFLTAEEQEKYQALGLEIIAETLRKPIFPKEDLSEGFYSVVNPMNNEVLDLRKTWWQHCEAVIALSLAGETYQEQRQQLERFYLLNFPDKEYGGEFFYLDENNTPITSELKGSIGKAAYHSIEMFRFLSQYTIREHE